jgi:hypothetical protein
MRQGFPKHFYPQSPFSISISWDENILSIHEFCARGLPNCASARASINDHQLRPELAHLLIAKVPKEPLTAFRALLRCDYNVTALMVLMRRFYELHLEFPFAGKLLRDTPAR